MDYRIYATCLWPGLSRVWFRGDLPGLLPAMAMTLGLNALIVLRFVYPEWLSPNVRLVGWILVFAWMISVVRNYRALPRLIAPRAAMRAPDRFVEAQAEFLRGNWVEAERLLRANLRVETRDAPALLMLSAVYRQTGRYDMAQKTLDLLHGLEVGDAWFLEARAERYRLQRARGEVPRGEVSSKHKSKESLEPFEVGSTAASPIP